MHHNYVQKYMLYTVSLKSCLVWYQCGNCGEWLGGQLGCGCIKKPFFFQDNFGHVRKAIINHDLTNNN